MRVKRGGKGASPEFRGRGNGRSSRKPADQLDSHMRKFPGIEPSSPWPLASHHGEPASITGRVNPRYFRKWESCRTMPLVGGFSRGSPTSIALAFPSLHPCRFFGLRRPNPSTSNDACALDACGSVALIALPRFSPSQQEGTVLGPHRRGITVLDENWGSERAGAAPSPPPPTYTDPTTTLATLLLKAVHDICGTRHGISRIVRPDFVPGLVTGHVLSFVAGPMPGFVPGQSHRSFRHRGYYLKLDDEETEKDASILIIHPEIQKLKSATRRTSLSPLHEGMRWFSSVERASGYDWLEQKALTMVAPDRAADVECAPLADDCSHAPHSDLEVRGGVCLRKHWPRGSAQLPHPVPRSHVLLDTNMSLRQSQHIIPTVKHEGGSVMVWGFMASPTVSNLAFIEGAMDVTKNVSNLSNSMPKLGLTGVFVFRHYNDPKRNVMNTKEWLFVRPRRGKPFTDQLFLAHISRSCSYASKSATFTMPASSPSWTIALFPPLVSHSRLVRAVSLLRHGTARHAIPVFLFPIFLSEILLEVRTQRTMTAVDLLLPQQPGTEFSKLPYCTRIVLLSSIYFRKLERLAMNRTRKQQHATRSSSSVTNLVPSAGMMKTQQGSSEPCGRVHDALNVSSNIDLNHCYTCEFDVGDRRNKQEIRELVVCRKPPSHITGTLLPQARRRGHGSWSIERRDTARACLRGAAGSPGRWLKCGVIAPCLATYSRRLNWSLHNWFPGRRANLLPACRPALSPCTARSSIVVRALASHHGDQGSIPGGFTLGFSYLGIVLDNAGCRRVFSSYSRFSRPPHTRLITLIGSQDLDAEKRGSDKGDTATHYKHAIAAKRKVLYWRAGFLSHCLYLWDFQR
ncbi:hypothetical protein PR048_032885 [Dryococelus australis]|uniref:Uncharacterized protein n=1 Tax=Dryococelus australis TaxID=614101 RepID=A0ABQ9G3H1_9NEOP|nr:hypothetical protein PR048_032885 [Dryococelus australis]